MVTNIFLGLGLKKGVLRRLVLLGLKCRILVGVRFLLAYMGGFGVDYINKGGVIGINQA